MKSIPSYKLLKGEKIIGEFRAKENDLGIIMVRFNNYIKPDFASEDTVLFKVKEENQNKWYYVGEYRSGSFEHQDYYPFGFPIIANSQGKVYQFEIVSLSGNSNNALEVNRNQPILLTGYQFPKSEIFGSKFKIVSFLIKKSFYSFTNLNFIFSSTIYLLPLFFYLLLFLINRHLSLAHYLPFLVMSLILIDIFAVNSVFLGFLFGLVGLWILSIIIYKLNYSTSFVYALILIFIWVLTVILGHKEFENKLNIWVYAFILIGTAQLFWEEITEPKQRNGYRDILRKSIKN